MKTKLYGIEKLSKSRNATGRIWFIREARWVNCNQLIAMLRNFDAAVSYAEEFGFQIGRDVKITEFTFMERKHDPR